jgi:hypothetical protein
MNELCGIGIHDMLYIFALWFVEWGSSDHNHFKGEITSYKDATTIFAKKHVCEGWKFQHWIKFKKGFEKGDKHVVITIELTTIVSLITTFEPKLVFMFFHMDPLNLFIYL